MNINFDRAARKPKGPLAQALTVIVGVIVIGLSLMFSLVVFAIVAILGLIFVLYFWWKTRELRKQLRDQAAMQASNPASRAPAAEASIDGGAVIEGEAVRVIDPEAPADQNSSNP